MRLAVLPLHQPGLLIDGRRLRHLGYTVAGGGSWWKLEAVSICRRPMGTVDGHY